MAAKKKVIKRKTPAKRKSKAINVATNKGAALADRLQKRFGSKITTLAREKQALAQIKEFIPTGIDVLDRAYVPSPRLCAADWWGGSAPRCGVQLRRGAR